MLDPSCPFARRTRLSLHRSTTRSAARDLRIVGGRNVRVPAMDQPPEITRKSRSSQSSWASFDIDDTPLSAVELHHAHLRTRIAADIDICDT